MGFYSSTHSFAEPTCCIHTEVAKVLGLCTSVEVQILKKTLDSEMYLSTRVKGLNNFSLLYTKPVLMIWQNKRNNNNKNFSAHKLVTLFY